MNIWYGLSNAPIVFQSYMDEIFREYLNRFVIVYIDDILIYSPTYHQHVRYVKQVLQKLRNVSFTQPTHSFWDTA